MFGILNNMACNEITTAIRELKGIVPEQWAAHSGSMTRGLKDLFLSCA